MSLLGKTGNYIVTGVKDSQQNIIEVARNGKPHVLVIDADAPGFDAETLQDVKNISTPPAVMLLLDNITRHEFQRYSEAGIENLLLKDASAEEILNAVEAAVSKRKHYSSEILEKILDSDEKKPQADTKNQLTPSEKEVVRLIAGGLTTKQIAARRNISFHTVNTHRKNIFRKLQVSNASELTMKAIKAGWIDNIEYYI